MPVPYIQGCINPIIKRQLLKAIDGGCRGTDLSDPICTVFRSELNDLPSCERSTPNPMFDREPIPPKKVRKPRKQPTGPVALTPYQKHMSACLGDKDSEGHKVYSFEDCRVFWKTGQSMESQYSGSGYAKTRIRNEYVAEPAPEPYSRESIVPQWKGVEYSKIKW